MSRPEGHFETCSPAYSRSLLSLCEVHPELAQWTGYCPSRLRQYAPIPDYIPDPIAVAARHAAVDAKVLPHRRAGLTATQIAARCNLSLSIVNAACARLIAAGLVPRKTHGRPRGAACT